MSIVNAETDSGSVKVSGAAPTSKCHAVGVAWEVCWQLGGVFLIR